MDTKIENAVHVSVLLEEILEFFSNNVQVQEPWLLDGTLGLGGHSKAILTKFSQDGKKVSLCGLDRDPDAIMRATENLSEFGEQIHIFERDFASFQNVLPQISFQKFDAVLLDLGVSSLQLDVAERGFSYHKDGQLNMRMDKGILAQRESLPHSSSAKTFVNKADFELLKRVIVEFGEDPQAGRIAKAIIAARQRESIESTKQLAEIVYQAYPAKWRAKARNHPATRTFQAIRMYVNDELGQLNFFLDNILKNLAIGGILGIISFHSLEDRIVKQKFKMWSNDCICPPHLPICNCNHQKQVEVLTKKPILPSQEECRKNPRASSAKLRFMKKV